MTDTHTPGPWYVEGESDNMGEAAVIVSGIPNGVGRIVAWTANSLEADTDNETTTDEDRANARLIANAPLLFKILEGFLATLVTDDLEEEAVVRSHYNTHIGLWNAAVDTHQAITAS
jgi:hypothetical protein